MTAYALDGLIPVVDPSAFVHPQASLIGDVIELARGDLPITSAEDVRVDRVVADCLTLIEQEVKGKSGISGAAVKVAYKTAKTFAKGYLQSTVESLLPDLVTQLEPYWADFAASGAAGFGDYLVKHGEEVSEALLSVSDARAKMSDAVLETYGGGTDLP